MITAKFFAQLVFDEFLKRNDYKAHVIAERDTGPAWDYIAEGRGLPDSVFFEGDDTTPYFREANEHLDNLIDDFRKA